jgi:hypothetical protein
MDQTLAAGAAARTRTARRVVGKDTGGARPRLSALTRDAETSGGIGLWPGQRQAERNIVALTGRARDPNLNENRYEKRSPKVGPGVGASDPRRAVEER